MRYSRFLFSLFLCLLIFSCEDDDVSLVTYPSFYHKSGLMSSGNMRVFSSMGEIKSNSVINRYAEYDTSYYSYYAKDISNYAFMDSVKFIDSKNAILNHQYSNQDCLYSQENDLLVLTEVDTGKDCCTYREVMSRSILYYISQVKPEIYSEYLYSSTRGDYYFGFVGKRKFVFTKSGQQLVAPIIQFTQHYGSVFNVTTRGFVNNVLQPDFYTYLAIGDTVTLMESLIRYDK